MSVSSQRDVSPAVSDSRLSEPDVDHQLSRWGGFAALAGVASMIVTFAVVIGLGLPGASDPETLTDFADLEAGRIAEHFFYLGALILFALHMLVMQRLLRRAHPPAALFGMAVSLIGYVIMAASSVLHVSTSPLADLYTEPNRSAADLRAIEYAWHGAQSVFDTMLLTGMLLVPIGIILFGIAMRSAPLFGLRLAWAAIAVGALGLVGAAIEIFDRSLEFSGLSILAMLVFHLATGWRTLQVGQAKSIDLTAP